MLLYEKHIANNGKLGKKWKDSIFFYVLDIHPFNDVQMASVKYLQVVFPFLFVSP